MARAGFKVADIYADFAIDVDGPIGKAAARIKARAKDFEAGGTSIGQAIATGQDKGYERASKDLAKAAESVGEAAGSAAGDGQAKGYEKTSSKTATAAKKNAQRSLSQFQAIQWAAGFAGMPVAATGAAALTVGALEAVPLAVIGYAATVASANTQVQDSYNHLADDVTTTMANVARPLALEFGAAADQIDASFTRLKPGLASVFADTEPDVALLTDSVTTLAERAFPGLVVMAHNSAEPLIALTTVAGQVGDGFRTMATNLAGGATAASRDLVILGGAIGDLEGFVGSLAANLAGGGTTSLSTFRSALQQAESAILTLTASGSSVYGFFNGFGASVNGMLTIVRGAAAVLALIPDELTQFAGAFTATSRVASMFGLDVGNAFDGVGGKIKAAATGTGTWKDAVGGLVGGALNPATLAVTGLSLGLQILGQHEADAAAVAAAHADRVRSLADALRESNGAIDENVKKTAAEALQDYDAGDGKRNLLHDVSNLAGPQGMGLLTQAYLGNASAGDQLRTILEANIAAHTKATGATSLYGQATGNTAVRVDDVGKANQQLLDILNSESGTFGQAVLNNKDLAAAMAATGNVTGGVSKAQELAQTSAAGLSSAFSDLSSSTGDAQSQVSDLINILDTLTGRVPTHEEAIQSINDTLRQMADSFGKGADHAKGWGSALLNADGTVNTVSANGSQLQDMLVQLQTGFAQSAQSINGLVAGGMSFTDATAKVNGELTNSRQRFLDQAQAMGLTKQQAAALADQYGLIPGLVETAVHQPGMLDAITKAGVLQQDVKAIPNSWTVTVTGLTAAAEANLTALGYHVTHMPNGTITVTAPNVGAVAGQIDYAARDRTATITVNGKYTGGYGVGPGGVSTGGQYGPRAAGGIDIPGTIPMASGGVLGMSHIASVVPPNMPRLIGDNTRVPEAFIPLDPSSGRSQQILATANAAMGQGGAPGIDYNAFASAVAQAVAAVFAGGLTTQFDATNLEKGLTLLKRQRGRR